MKKFVVLLPLLTFFLLTVSSASSEFSSDRLVTYRLKEVRLKDIRNDFSPDEKIYADFTFLQKEEETGLEFRWINPLNNKEQTYFEIVRSAIIPRKRTVTCWLLLQSSLADKIVGSRFFGLWRLEIWVNSSRVAETTFNVGN